jgi:hypothetical protein
MVKGGSSNPKLPRPITPPKIKQFQCFKVQFAGFLTGYPGEKKRKSYQLSVERGKW